VCCGNYSWNGKGFESMGVGIGRMLWKICWNGMGRGSVVWYVFEWNGSWKCIVVIIVRMERE
jgi:hypothetical protein